MIDEDLPQPIDPDARWPAGLRIRARTPADAAGIATLHNMAGYRYGTLRTPYHSIEEIRKSIENQSDGSIGLIALIDGVVVGDVGLTRYANRRIHAASIGMGVHDKYAGRGIGRALMGEILAIADRWLNLCRIELTVYTDNDKAIRLYERNGFVREGHFSITVAVFGSSEFIGVHDSDVMDDGCINRDNVGTVGIVAARREGSYSWAIYAGAGCSFGKPFSGWLIG